MYVVAATFSRKYIYYVVNETKRMNGMGYGDGMGVRGRKGGDEDEDEDEGEDGEKRVRRPCMRAYACDVP